MFKKILFYIALLLLAGCAGVQGTSSPSSAAGKDGDEDVSVRAEARWQAMIARDLDAAYEFLSPGSKTANPLTLFKAKIRPLDWRSAKALSASCDGDKCSVKLHISFYHSKSHGEIATVLEETWIRDAGKWWYVFTG